MAWSGAVPKPRRVEPTPPWETLGISESAYHAMDDTKRQFSLVKSQDQGINPTGDETIPFTYGSLVGNMAKYGVKETQRQLLKRRLIKDHAGKPQPFYHGTREKYTGDIKPTRIVSDRNPDIPLVKNGEWNMDAIMEGPAQVIRSTQSIPGHEARLFMTTNPQYANAFSNKVAGSLSAKELKRLPPYSEGSRVYKKYLAPLRGKETGMKPLYNPSSSSPWERHAVITDPKVLVAPWEIAPKPLPNMAPLTAPALMDSMTLRGRE